MVSSFIIVFGVIYAFFLACGVAETIEHKAPWSDFVRTAGIGAAFFGGVGWLAHSILSWMLDSGMAVWLSLIVFGLAFVWLFLGAVAGLLQPRS